MLTQRVASPLIQLSHLLQQYDEAQFAVRAISALVNQPAEEGRLRAGIRTPLKGRIEFEDVRFRYRGAAKPALNGISFTVPEGTILGIMGRSGSGKTTVARLLQMLDGNYEGLIKIDGNDLREIDIDYLRSSLGVVPQECFLFSGTIRSPRQSRMRVSRTLSMQRGSLAPRNLSSTCRVATTPISRRVRAISRAASVNGWRSHGHSSGIRAS
jgi:ABC-type bacteriocin/lantibiotic exporter with double-glycine peptidase domain